MGSLGSGVLGFARSASRGVDGLRSSLTDTESDAKSEGGRLGPSPVEPGDEVVVRATGERALVVAVVDASGTLLLRVRDEDPFQLARDDVEWPWSKHASCACCGG